MSDAIAAPGADPRYKYQDIRPPAVPVEVLDGIAASVFDPTLAKMGWFGLLVAGLKLALALVYLEARARLLAAQLEYTKQRYELDQASNNQADLDHDNLSGEKRTP